jgi:hypothetical protein
MPLKSSFVRRLRGEVVVIAGLAFNFVPLPFLPANLPVGWFGAVVFVLALAGALAIITMT